MVTAGLAKLVDDVNQQAPAFMDPSWPALNAKEKFSIFTCTKPWTLVVAKFAPPTDVQSSMNNSVVQTGVVSPVQNLGKGLEASLGHEESDVAQWCEWGVDYLKYDWCSTGSRNAEEAYATMADALRATGRPIVLSICEWGTASPGLWAPAAGHLWRTTGDIFDAWEGRKEWSHGMVNILDMQVELSRFAGPNHWNDPDMLEVGNGMGYVEDRSHFSLWCMLAAPLAAGNDLRIMSPPTREILTHKEMIDIDQAGTTDAQHGLALYALFSLRQGAALGGRARDHGRDLR